MIDNQVWMFCDVFKNLDFNPVASDSLWFSVY